MTGAREVTLAIEPRTRCNILEKCSDRIWYLHQVAGSWVRENFGIFPGQIPEPLSPGCSGIFFVDIPDEFMRGTIKMEISDMVGNMDLIEEFSNGGSHQSEISSVFVKTIFL